MKYFFEGILVGLPIGGLLYRLYYLPTVNAAKKTLANIEKDAEEYKEKIFGQNKPL